MRSNILFTLPFLVAIMTAITIVQANPVPTAAPVILKARQDGGPSTTAAITSTIQPGAGITGNGCNEVGNVAICCPEGYQAETNNNVSTCVKGDGGATFNGSGDDSGSGENDGGDSTESANDGTTITGDSGTIIVGGGSNGSIGGETIGGSTSTASSSASSSTSSSTSPTTTTSSSSSSTHNDVGKLSVPYTFAAAAMVGAAMITIV